MKLILLTATQLLELEALNHSGSHSQQLRPITLVDGRQALNADLQSDCGSEDLWSHYGPFLSMLPVESIAADNFVQTASI